LGLGACKRCLGSRGRPPLLRSPGGVLRDPRPPEGGAWGGGEVECRGGGGRVPGGGDFFSPLCVVDDSLPGTHNPSYDLCLADRERA